MAVHNYRCLNPSKPCGYYIYHQI